MSLHSGHIILIPNQYLVFLLNVACLADTNFIVFGLTRSGLEPTIYHTRVEHTNHYTTDEVFRRLHNDKETLVL
jgi:hypothetical protein